MKIIALLSMLAITLIAASGALPEGSVGGPMTIAMIFLAAALVVGLYEAWTMKRGPVGWIVNLVVAFIGGLVGAGIGATIIETFLVLALTLIKQDGALITAGKLPLYLGLNVQMLFTLFGAWGALQIVNRYR